MTDAATLERKVRALGPVFNAEVNQATRDIYRGAVALAPADDERVDVPYGDHARHRLDVYLPAGKSRGTVIYVHGGGFVGGDKNGDGVFYVNVGRWLARHDWTAVVPNYRLAPSDTWPAGAQDVSGVVAWASAQSQNLAPGGGPLVVWGQSAGACHVASWLFDTQVGGALQAEASAVILMSGFYEAKAPLADGPRAYFGADAADNVARSPLTHVRGTNAAVWLSVAELDPPDISQHTFALAKALTRASGSHVAVHTFAGHNHVSTVQSLGSPQTDAGTQILAFLESILNVNDQQGHSGRQT